MKLSLDMYCIDKNSTVKGAMEVIDRNTTGAALVIDENHIVCGVITDGDIRRALLRGNELKDSIDNIYSKDFKYATILESKKKVKEFMLKYRIRQLPLLDEHKKLIDIYFLDQIITYEKKDNYVFILAGGLGTRLRPLTEAVPKPMLKVGDKPILELIIEQFRKYGFCNFIISINYLGDVIENYFGDGKNFDVNIEYVREEKRLGTAGSIRLAEDKLSKPFIVINGDILTGIDFDNFLRYHVENEFNVTAGVRSYEFTVPYGVINAKEMVITSLEEKPTFIYYINSGVYALNPQMVKLIPLNEKYNMTDLINDEKEKSQRAGIYQITEYWADIGQPDDYKKANEDIKKFF